MRRRMMASILAPALTLTALSATMGLAQSSDPGATQPVTVELSNYKFTPSQLTLQHGKRYQLHFLNTSSGGHNFVAKEFFAASSIAPEDRSKISDGEVDLAGGQSVDISLVPNQTKTYKSRCTHFMHSFHGMKGAILVR